MRPRIRGFEQALEQPTTGVFTDEELDGLPEPAARYSRAAIAPGTPLAQTARITMRGRIKLKKWLRFAATMHV